MLIPSGFAINAPGFIHALNPDLNVNIAAQRIYALVCFSLNVTAPKRADPSHGLREPVSPLWCTT